MTVYKEYSVEIKIVQEQRLLAKITAKNGRFC